jgi:hypothetical protein
VRSAWARSAQLCCAHFIGQALADAGYVVEEACPPRYEDAVSCWARLIMGDFGSVLGMLE